MKTLGVIGGLGPMATAYFMQLVIEMTRAKTDQEHIPMIIYNCPQIPDRTNYMLGLSEKNPAPLIAACGQNLVKDGADIAAIPCITAHAMHDQIQKEVEIPIIHAIKEVVKYLQQQGIRKAALEATDGTVKVAVFQKELESAGIEVLLPSGASQKKIMHIIYDNVKAGNEVDMEAFSMVEEELLAKGAEVIILGCTELSMVKRDYKLKSCYVDAMEVLARAAVKECGSLKEEYEILK